MADEQKTSVKKTRAKKIELTEPAPKVIMVGVPCYGGQLTTEFMNSWTNLLALGEQTWPDGSVKFVLRVLDGESLITRGRNQIVRDFMETKNEAGEPVFTHLLFIDSDIGFTINNVARLVDSGYDVACGIYPIKMFNWQAIAAGIPPQTPTANIMQALTVPVVNGIDHSTVGEDGFAESVEGGTGFMLISRSAIEKLRTEYPNEWYRSDYRVGENVRIDNFFDCRVIEWPEYDAQGQPTGKTYPRYLSEDYAFCHLWRSMGGKVMVDTAAEVLAHRGFFTWGRA